ncbi:MULTISPECIES: PA2169 family four-helix-bundle protein [Flavobacterium]|uniref:PA2169 family four-helix-bundle protein n=1 Tax=Flavobacterium algoritolerans TaxID=3041254 RepID=A0ABT6VFN1_9FLAO|nr:MULTISPECIES: PA2169 family four-helix-bundle protein [Flavobacterium]MDI5896283.1 PA2169 family four-helix-bundle protein [Flavobacterium algoritolerans]MDI6049711.1 PA2169 family four-helix-bundle protein [Flavobacterium sp. XS2P24]
MNKEKSIVVLNNLIEINNDRIQVYETATIVTEESDLKNLFSEFQKTSEIFKSELAEEVQKMGGIPVDVIKKNNFFVKLWMNFKAKLVDKDREDILNTLEYKEFVAIKSYKETLIDNFDHLTVELLIILKSQQLLLTAHHDKVKKLGDLMLS